MTDLRASSDGRFTMLRHPNGATACIDENPVSPLISLSIRVRGGSGDDPWGKSGLAHLFEHLLFTGTPGIGRDRYLAAVQDVGAISRASTGVSWTNFATLCTPEVLGEILRLECDRFTETLPFVDADVLAREKSVVRTERRERVDSVPCGDAVEQLMGALYGASPFGRIPVGIDVEIDSITLADCMTHVVSGYAGDRVHIAVSGNVRAHEVHDRLGALLEVFPAGSPTVADEPAAPPARTVRELPCESQPKIFLGYHLPAADRAEYDEARLGSYFLAKGDGAYLRRELVDASSAMLSDVVIKTLTRVGASSVGIIEVTPRDGVSIDDARSAIGRVLTEFDEERVADADIERARSAYRRSWYRDDDTTSGRADGLSLALLRSGDPHRYEQELRPIISPDRSAVRTAVRWWQTDAIAAEVIYR